MNIRHLAKSSLAAALLLSFGAQAQDHAQHTMPVQQEPAKQEPAKQEPAKQESAEDHDDSKMDHSKMDHSKMGHAMPPNQPITPIPILTDADRAAAAPPERNHPVHDNTVHSFVLFNRLEGFDGDDASGLEWEGQAWIGTDTDRLWLRTEGERAGGKTEAADLEVMYGRPIAPWWNLVAGVRHDFQPGGAQNFAAIGVIGLAPYKFEVEATAYLGAGGRTAARIEAEYELLLTNRLVLQPLVELNFNGKEDVERQVGSGLSTAEAGVRLRYEVTRRFAPYVGIVYERAYGGTADLRRDDGEGPSDTRVVAGFRVWF